MPPFGLAHNLLSDRHPDTSPPAGGADPSDGQVATWSAALKAWIAADPTGGGVTVHGLLTGLDVDDHEQYALADKSRPDPWITAADFAARSLADLGTKDHDLLDGLTDDDHSIYALLSGRSGGQSLIGGLAASEHLTLQSTAHATRGYVRAQDDLQLLSNIIRDAGGNARLTLAAASPHVRLTGNLDVDGVGAFGSAATVQATRGLNVLHSVAGMMVIGAAVDIAGIAAAGTQYTFGVYGGARGQGTPTAANIYGLYFGASYETSSPCTGLCGIYMMLSSTAAGTGALAAARGLWLPAAGWLGSKPASVYAINVEDQGGAGVATAYGVRLLDQTATTVRLLELGPAVPYLRLLGGADPAANESKLSLKFGATLKQVTEYDADSAGAGYRALRVPN